MTYVITDACRETQDAACVEVCPVDCIHPAPEEPGYGSTDTLYIDPAECIDCAACITACPVNAIFADTELPEELTEHVDRNAAYFAESR